MASKIQFKVNSHLSLARMCEADETEKRLHYMQKAEDLLEFYPEHQMHDGCRRTYPNSIVSECKDFVVSKLFEFHGEMESKRLDIEAVNAGYSLRTLSRAKESLRSEKTIEYATSGSARNGTRFWLVRLCEF